MWTGDPCVIWYATAEGRATRGGTHRREGCILHPNHAASAIQSVRLGRSIMGACGDAGAGSRHVVALAALLVLAGSSNARADCALTAQTNREVVPAQRCFVGNCQLLGPEGLEVFVRQSGAFLTVTVDQRLAGEDAAGNAAVLMHVRGALTPGTAEIVGTDLNVIATLQVLDSAPAAPTPTLGPPRGYVPVPPLPFHDECPGDLLIRNLDGAESLDVWVTPPGTARSETPTVERISVGGSKGFYFVLADYRTGVTADEPEYAVRAWSAGGLASEIVEADARTFPPTCSCAAASQGRWSVLAVAALVAVFARPKRTRAGP